MNAPSTLPRPASWLSVTLFVAVHLSCLLALWVPFTWGAFALAVAGYLVHMWAITAGYHRYFSHRAYRTSRAMQFVLAVLGTSAMQNGPLWWASWHRRHHRHADTPDDVHSPLQTGFWNAQIGWVLSGRYDHPDLSNVRDLARYPELRFLDHHKWLPIVGYAVICWAIAGLPGLVWGFAISTVACLHATGFINSLAHVWGTRRYATTDTSRNNAVLAVLTLGEGWHNNHHHDMTSARQGERWWEIDVTWYTLVALSWVGLVWGLKGKPRAAAPYPQSTSTSHQGTSKSPASGVPSPSATSKRPTMLPADHDVIVTLPVADAPSAAPVPSAS